MIDRLYARVGASDNIARGQSTFMVEMQETAHILSGATSKSLVVLDEIGRGTATFDGLSIAWAVAEHIATNPRSRPKTLFATHYHELTDLADAFGGVVNFHVAAREWKDDIIFLHKILAGRSDRSYGIQVARLAGPAGVGDRARARHPGSLEQDELTRGGKPTLSGAAPAIAAAARTVPGRRHPPTRSSRSGFARSTSTARRRSMRLRILEDLKKEIDSDHDKHTRNHGITETQKPSDKGVVRVSVFLCFVLVCAAQPPSTSESSPSLFSALPTASIRASAATKRRSAFISSIYDYLLALDDQLRVIGGLASSWEQADPLTYIIHLRKGVRFHDGHELTADDVVYTFGCFIDPAFVSPRKGAYRTLDRVEAIDPYTVRFALKEPFGSFPIQLVMPVVPKGAGPELRDHPIGTGPYKFVSFAVDDHVELTAFPDYFRGKPANDGVVLKVVPDEIMRALELRKGSVDMVVNDLSPDVIHQLAEEKSVTIAESPGTDYAYVGINMRDPVLKDRRVRHALGYAIDRQAIVDHLRRGLARPAVGILPPASWAFDEGVFQFTHDPAQGARAARRGRLSRSGWRRPRAAAAAVAEGVDQRVHPPAGGGHSAGPEAGRHRSRRALVRVRDALCRRAEGQLPVVHAAVGRRVGSRHAAARLPLEADAAERIQSRLLRESGSRSPDRCGDGGDDGRRIAAGYTARRSGCSPRTRRTSASGTRPTSPSPRTQIEGVKLTPSAEFTFLREVTKH